jgi:UDP-N-acetylmuramoylalanine--D-glutamate ligase
MPPQPLPAAAEQRDWYRGRRVTVMGLGRFGGGVGATRFLAARGARVTLTDLKAAGELAEPLQEIDVESLTELILGEHREDDFATAELVVASPAVRPDHPLLQLARSQGAEVTTEIGLFWRHCPAPIIGVTGTVGKSTTAALIHHFLASAGRTAWLGGNIGGSLLADLDALQPQHWVVLELSSFQLTYLDAERRSPRIAVVTNFRPNHLDWHCSSAEYRQAKQALLRHQQSNDVAILPGWDAEPAAWRGPATSIVVAADQWPEGCDLQSLPPGRHQLQNAALAMAAAAAAGVAPEQFRPALATFRGLPHRLELVGEWGGRRFYDDSKSTTPEAAIAALRAFQASVIVLAGGSDKRVDLRPLADELTQRAKAVALMGETAAELDRLMGAESASGPPRNVSRDFPGAFRWAVAQSAPGDIILLSPGCASFGWFRDYADRGDRFRKLVEGLER